MPTINTGILTARVKNALIERVDEAAARTGRTRNQILNALLTAAYGDGNEPREGRRSR